MFTIDELLSKRNQKEAMKNLETKHDSCGTDGILVSQFPEYWQKRILKEILDGSYNPGMIKTTEIRQYFYIYFKYQERHK